jgi:hypothetical protein
MHPITLRFHNLTTVNLDAVTELEAERYGSTEFPLGFGTQRSRWSAPEAGTAYGLHHQMTAQVDGWEARLDWCQAPSTMVGVLRLVER